MQMIRPLLPDNLWEYTNTMGLNSLCEEWVVSCHTILQLQASKKAMKLNFSRNEMD